MRDYLSQLHFAQLHFAGLRLQLGPGPGATLVQAVRALCS